MIFAFPTLTTSYPKAIWKTKSLLWTLIKGSPVCAFVVRISTDIYAALEKR
jgi:hypothetical protein